METLPKIYSYVRSENRPIQKILVVGCGGTGAYAIAFLSRILSTVPEKNIEFCIADGDEVETKNLSRQHFVQCDVGRNKAEVLAERYSSAFGISIEAITEEIKGVEQIKDFCNCSMLIIGCVDNNASRKIIRNHFFSEPQYESKFWIDAGNEETVGQVVLGINPSWSAWDSYSAFKSDKQHGSLSLPHVLELYPDMEKEDKFNSEISCAERAVSAPQNMMTNVTAATLITNYAQKLIFNQPIKSHAVEFTINNVFTTRLNTIENLQKVKYNRRPDWEKKLSYS
jgi:PRTRC genetic system ThiF family protein